VRVAYFLELAAVTFLVLVLAGGVSAQRGDVIRLKPDSTQIRVTAFAQATAVKKPDSASKLPPLSMTCPMHPDVVESKPGSCPLCKMSLVPVRLDTSWMCPIHTHVMPDKPGACPLCGRSLVEARVAVTWTCAAQPGISRLEPGTCPDGTPTRERRTLRPHGNHNPQHGGQFFMAADNWHHVEGTYPRAGVFRLYIYDDYARPLSAASLKRVAARVVTDERYDPKTRTSTDLKAFPLRPSRDGAYLEARVSGATLPATMTAKIRIKPESPEYRFDFTFAGLTKEPPRAAVQAARAQDPIRLKPDSTTQSSAPNQPSAPKQSSAPSTALEDPSAGPPTPIATPIPETVPAILADLKIRNDEIRQLIRDGQFGAVWVPAFRAKDLAVALEPHIGHLPPADREAAEPALQRLVRFAWLLDSFGDLGNRQQVEDAYAAFGSAAADVATAFKGAQ
jgi:hypothetical protein